MDYKKIMEELQQTSEQKVERQKITTEILRRRLVELSENAGIELTGEHLAVMESIFGQLDNVFITGGAGVGKTTFVKNILIPELEYRGVKFDVTASTGIAASHLSAKTLHSWAGVGLGPLWNDSQAVPDLPENLVQHIYSKTLDNWSTAKKMSSAREGIKKKIRSCQLLIVEEVSMCPGRGFLDYLDYFFKSLRDSDRPFGGIQMVFLGDFCQLPPVSKSKSPSVDWAFLSKSWLSAKIKPFELTKVYRQSDLNFVKILNKLRLGQSLDFGDLNILQPHIRRPSAEEQVQMTSLVPTNRQADLINNASVAFFPGEEQVMNATFEILPSQIRPYETADRIKRQLADRTVRKESMTLKEGMAVLMVKNDPAGDYVNGTRAVVKEFHKDSQGDLEAVSVTCETLTDDGKSEEKTIRIQRSPTTRGPAEDPTDIALAFDEAAGKQVSQPAHPRMWQFPFIPAAGITVHKAQGMSLDNCVVDVEKAFAPGHVYVALSRLRTLQGLILTSENLPVFADPQAMRYHQAIVPKSIPL